VENRNSADYMEFEKTVKVRRRQIFPLNNLMRPENTPLFPTGELHYPPSFNCENAEFHSVNFGFLERVLASHT
jgi:hypothetical protein